MTDKRSKGFGQRCGNYAQHGSDVCFAHSGQLQALARVNVLADRVLVAGVPAAAQEAALQDDREERERIRKQLREHFEEVERRKTEAREKAMYPPELTDAQRAEGLVYHRNYDVQGQTPYAHLDHEKRAFVWQLIPLRDLVHREREQMVNDFMQPREDAVEAKLADIRERLARNRRKLAFDPLNPAHRRGAPPDPLEEELSRYEGKPIDLNNLEGVRP